MEVNASAQMVRRNDTFTVRVRVSTGTSPNTPVRISVADSRSGFTIEPAVAIVNAPGEATFKVTVTSGRRGDVHVLKFTGEATGLDAAEQTLTILVEPIPHFLPMILKSN
jgi:hypothetical protein